MPNSPDTSSQSRRQSVLQFGDCEFDELAYQLKVRGQVVEMERKPLELLRYLLSKPGEVVGKEELLEAVWPGVLVVDASLATAVSKLRKVLGEQEIIQTVPRVGYRIAVRVDRVSVAAPDSQFADEKSAEPKPQGQPRRKRFQFSSIKQVLWAASAVVLAIAASIGLIAGRSRKPAPLDPVNVAILPFQNVSANGSLDYLRFALPDEIAHTLSSAHSLSVRPLATSAQFSSGNADFRKIGNDLDVNRIVAGHFLVEGDRIHVTTEAIDTIENRIVWQDDFDVASNNLLAIQEQIAVISRGKLANALGVREFIPDAPPRATNEEAYELYLQSGALNWDAVPDRQAIELLRRAVLLDPNYAPAWGMLALRYYGVARFGGGGEQMMALSDAATERELALNPDSLDAIAEMTIHRTERGDLVKAHQIALELLSRKPDDPNLHHVLSYVLRYGGSLDEAGRQCEITVLLATKVVWGSCSTTFMELGNYERARFFIRRDLSSEWSKAHAIEVLMREGKTTEALRIPAPQVPHWDSYKMLLACASGAAPAAIRALASKVGADDDPEVDYLFAGHLAYCGQTEAALRMLKTAIDHNYCSFPAMDIDPFFNQLRTNPQFRKVRSAGIACHNDFASNRDKTQSKQAQSASNKPAASANTPSRD
jgi:DNA-binding winged helix-turn-helix (wHTH) protein/TolB-like protein